MSSADPSEASDDASEASHISDPDFEPPPMQRAALVLCADSLVRAYETVDAARSAHPSAGAAHCISEFGAKAKPLETGEHHYTLLIEGNEGPSMAPAAAGSVLDDSLLRTNVQKAVRRMDAAAARLSVLQYFAQRPAKGQNEYQKKLLTRLPVIAAEDATTVPLLPTAIFHLVGATSLGPDAAHGAAQTLAACAAQLAAAPRDPVCLSKHAWEPDTGEQLKLMLLHGARTTLGRERLFDKGWSPLDCAQVIMVNLAARIVGRACKSYEMDGAWLFALELAMRARLAAGGAACAPLPSGATDMAQPPVADPQPDGTLLPEASRLYFSADFHNPTRFARLCGALRDVETKKQALKEAMKHEALRNVRDHGMVHRLTLPVTPQPNAALAPRWREEARALWVAQPAAPPPAAGGGGKKRSSAGGPSVGLAKPGSKQPKLSFGAASSNP